jgi:UPF0716 family protein affecting phage T7 exclusion
MHTTARDHAPVGPAWYMEGVGSMFFLVLALPLMELWLLARLALRFGILPVTGITIFAAVCGVVLAGSQGQRALRDLNDDLAQGRPPERQVISGALILLSALLFLIPGVVSDFLALLLLLPPVRHGVADHLAKRFGMPPGQGKVGGPSPRTRRHTQAARTEVGRVYVRDGDVIDTTGEEVKP